MAVNQPKLLLLLARAQHDLASAQTAILISIGFAAGLYDALAGAPRTAEELAQATATDRRYVESWLVNQAAGGYVTPLPDGRTYTLSEEQRAAFTEERSAWFLPPAFDFAVALAAAHERVAAAMKTGAGIGNESAQAQAAIARMARAKAGTVIDLLPAEAVARLGRGANVLEVGCGAGETLIEIARRYPAVRAVGIDSNRELIERARQAAQTRGVAERIDFRVQSIHDFRGSGFDVVLCIETLHEMANPLSALTRMRESTSGGTVVVIEQDSANRQLLAATDFLYCLPASIAAGGGAVGALAPESVLRDLLRSAGFRAIDRCAASSPFVVLRAEA